MSKCFQNILCHEIGAGSRCLKCDCPGLDLHYWRWFLWLLIKISFHIPLLHCENNVETFCRKMCKVCSCRMDDHDVILPRNMDHGQIVIGSCFILCWLYSFILFKILSVSIKHSFDVWKYTGAYLFNHTFQLITNQCIKYCWFFLQVVYLISYPSLRADCVYIRHHLHYWTRERLIMCLMLNWRSAVFMWRSYICILLEVIIL